MSLTPASPSTHRYLPLIAQFRVYIRKPSSRVHEPPRISGALMKRPRVIDPVERDRDDGD
jgi:hypothetical protein